MKCFTDLIQLVLQRWPTNLVYPVFNLFQLITFYYGKLIPYFNFCVTLVYCSVLLTFNVK